MTGYYNCSGLHAGILGLLSEASSRGILTSLNPQYDATGQWGGIQNLCPFLDIIVCNEDELKYMTTGSIESTDIEVIHYVDMLFNWGCRNSVVVTMGGKGAAVFYKDKQSSPPSISIIHEKPPMVNVVDSTGQAAQLPPPPLQTNYY
jgi:sugar/nucleoside kinase (ribokinase family)